MSPEREELRRLLEIDLAIMKESSLDHSTEITRVDWALKILPEAPESQVWSFKNALDRRHQKGELGIGMMEELTTEMHEEFQVDEETDRRLNAFSLAEMERAGIPVTEERLEERGLNWTLYEHYKEMFAVRHDSKNNSAK